MKEAVFYLTVRDLPQFVYRFCRKMYQEQRRVWLVFDDETAMQQMDTQLWSQEDIGFLPHEIIHHTENTTEYTPIVLTLADSGFRLPENAVVINFTDDTLLLQTETVRIIEISADHEAAKQEARRRFAAYRTRGFALTHYDMQGKA